MAGSDRSLIVAAIFGLAAISFGFGAALGGDWAVQPHDHTGKPYASATVYNSTDLGNTFAAYPYEESNSCYSAKNHDSADLCAQWRAAIAAEKAARATEWTNYLSVVGAVLTLAGLAFVVRGLAHSRQANSLARESMVTENRAWVKIEADQGALFTLLITDNLLSTIVVSLKNIGKSVATNVRVTAEITTLDWRQANEIPSLYRGKDIDAVPWQHHRYLFPDDTEKDIRAICSLVDHKGMIRMLHEGQEPDSFVPYVVVTARYKLAFDAKNASPRKTEAIFELRPVGADLGVFNFAAQGEFAVRVRKAMLGDPEIT